MGKAKTSLIPADWRSQSVTSNPDEGTLSRSRFVTLKHGDNRLYPPYAPAQQAVAVLASLRPLC